MNPYILTYASLHNVNHPLLSGLTVRFNEFVYDLKFQMCLGQEVILWS